MHELSLCQSIAGITARHAGDRRVAAIHVRIGQLRQVVPDTLVYCWDLVSAGTPLEGARLEVERVAARLRCRDCSAQASIGDLPVFTCTACGSISTEITAGEEFLVTSLDLAEEEALP